MKADMREELERIREWADAKIAAGQEPPWAWYQYMKLRETLDAILAGMAAVSPMESSPQSAPHSERHLRLVEAIDPKDSPPPHPAGLPTRLPT